MSEQEAVTASELEGGDWFDAMRNSQRTLSDRIAKDITAMLLKRETMGDVRKYLGIVRGEEHDAEKTPTDDKTYNLGVRKAVEGDTFEAVLGYTELLATRLVINGLKPMPVPLSSQVPYAKLSDDYGPSVPLLQDVVGRMNSQSSLPLVGRIVDGQITPNVETLNKWKEGIDWNKAPDSADLDGL